MKYKNEGTTISFKIRTDDGMNMKMIATYTPHRRISNQYYVGLKLYKVVFKNGAEYKLEHVIGRQLIHSNHNNIKNNISRIVDYGMTNGQFNDDINDFKSEICSID